MYVDVLDSFTASRTSFPDLEMMIIRNSKVTCAHLSQHLPGVKIFVTGKECEQVCFFSVSF